jgi:hypothetical protein
MRKAAGGTGQWQSSIAVEPGTKGRQHGHHSYSSIGKSVASMNAMGRPSRKNANHLCNDFETSPGSISAEVNSSLEFPHSSYF